MSEFPGGTKASLAQQAEATVSNAVQLEFESPGWYQALLAQQTEHQSSILRIRVQFL